MSTGTCEQSQNRVLGRVQYVSLSHACLVYFMVVGDPASQPNSCLTPSLFPVPHCLHCAEISLSPHSHTKSHSPLTISQVFVDPTGRHILLTTSPSPTSALPSPSHGPSHISASPFSLMTTSSPASSASGRSELYYLHATWQKARHVAALKAKGGVHALPGVLDANAASAAATGAFAAAAAAGGTVSIGGVTAVAWHPGSHSDSKLKLLWNSHDITNDLAVVSR